MDYSRLVELLKKRLFPVLIMVLLAAFAAGMASLASPVKYQARAVLWLSRPDPGTGGATALDYNSLMMYRQLTRTYGELATSEAVLQKLSGYLNNTPGPDELRRMVSVRRVKDLELLEITVIDVSPERAAYIANRLAALLQQEEKMVWAMSNLRLINPAQPNDRPAGHNILLNMVTAGLAGLFLSFLLIAALEYFSEKRGRSPSAGRSQN